MRGSLVKAGDRSYCVIGEWDRFESLAAARPQMVALLDSLRDTLEDLGGRLGQTDPVSGETILELKQRGDRDAVAKRRGPRYDVHVQHMIMP